MPSGFLLFTHLPVPRHTVVQGGVYYANRQYPSLCVRGGAGGTAGRRAGVNTTVRPYAVYRLRADASGWQSQILDGVQVFDGQQTVARLEFLPGGGDGNALPAREAAPQTVTIPPHVLFAGDGGSGPAPEERLPGNVLSEVVVPRKITVHLGRPAASARNVTVSFQSYIANVASSEVYPTWVGHAVYSAPLPRRASRACTAAKSARETSPSWVPGTTIHCDRGNRTLRADL